MKRIHLGTNVESNRPIYLPEKALDTHLHLIGATGKGKTTLLERLLQSLFLQGQFGFVIIDRMGAFSFQLLMWIASRFCSRQVRERLIYFEAAREDVVFPINPFLYDTQAHGFYRVMRAVEFILRAWESQNIEAMPRLARWIFNAFWAAAQLALNISDCVHFLMPASPLHARLIALLPERDQIEWNEITHGHGGEVARILESVRNRLKPYFDNNILRRMFSGTTNRLDLLRFMRERKIIIVNLAPRNRLSPQIIDAIGGLIINELIAVSQSLADGERIDTIGVFDEFQNFVSPDFEHAIPEMRQKGTRLILSHQSLAQLQRGDTDLKRTIYQCQSRVVFGLQGEDADELAHEHATLTFDPSLVKNEIHSTKQRQVGHKIVELQNYSESASKSETSSTSQGRNLTSGESVLEAIEQHPARRTASHGEGSSYTDQSGSSNGTTTSRGWSQSLVPIYEEYQELSSRTYVGFQEHSTVQAQRIRQLPTGRALLKLVNDPSVYELQVKRSAPGFLGFDMQTIHKHFPKAIEDTHRLIEENFARGPFCTPAEIEREAAERLERVLGGHLTIPSVSLPVIESPVDEKHPFA